MSDFDNGDEKHYFTLSLPLSSEIYAKVLVFHKHNATF